MDNLTHSLAGAVLGQLGLKRRTAYAMPALIIGANLPDIDAFAALLGAESLAIRRGVTHGPLAMLVLPLLLTAALLAWNRWRPNRIGRPLHRGWLLALAYLGVLSHPALDWMNSYGIRLLAPLSQRWFAGDTLFIIDVWIWLALGLAVFVSLRRERRGRADWRAPALAGFGAACLYILGNGLLTGSAEATTQALLIERGTRPTLVVANPVPVTFWRREMLWRDAVRHGSGEWRLDRGATLAPGAAPNALDDPRLAARTDDPAVRAFLFWSRMPVVVERDGVAVLTDQRFAGPGFALLRGRGRLSPFTIPLEEAPR